jgi:hypothetical protein
VDVKVEIQMESFVHQEAQTFLQKQVSTIQIRKSTITLQEVRYVEIPSPILSVSAFDFPNSNK